MKFWMMIGLLLLVPLAAAAADIRLEFTLDGRQLGQFCASTAEVTISEIRGFIVPGAGAPELGLELRSGLTLEELRHRLSSAGLASAADRLETTGNGEFLLFSTDSTRQTLPDPPGEGEWLALGLTTPGGTLEFRCDGGQARLLVPLPAGENAADIAARLPQLVQSAPQSGLTGAFRQLLAAMKLQNTLAGTAVFSVQGTMLDEFARAVQNQLLTVNPEPSVSAEEKLCRDQRALLLLAVKFAWLQGKPLKTVEDLIAGGFLVQAPRCPAGGKIDLDTRDDGSLDAGCARHP